MQLLNVPLLFLIVRPGRGTVSAAGGGNWVEGFLEFNQETGTLGRSEEKDWRRGEFFEMQELSIYIHIYCMFSVFLLPII